MRNKKWISMLLALLASVGLWVYVVTVVNPEDKITLTNIPVVFEGEDVLREDYELIIMDDNVASGVSLTFHGKVSDLNKLREKKGDLLVTIDVSRNVRSARDYSINYDISDVTLPSSVSATALSLADTRPNSINFTVEKLAKKTIDVKIKSEVETAEGYLAERITQDYEQIVIEGPEDVIETVDYALVTFQRENVDQTITAALDYTLMSVEGEVIESDQITSEVQQIQVTQPVSMFKDLPLEVGFVDGGGVTGNDVSAKIEPTTIRLSGDPAALDAIQSIRLSNIDLGALLSNSETVSRTIPIPEGCVNLSGVQEATVSVRIPNKAIKTLRVSNTNFQYVNKPEGLKVDPMTTVLMVSVRANVSDIDAIEEENLRVVADLSNVTIQDSGATTATVPVTIFVDGFTGAGAIGENTIVVQLSTLDQDNPET